MGGGDADEKYKEANALLSDMILNYRTIIGLGEKNINYLLDRFSNLLLAPNRDNIISAHLSGLFFGYSSFSRYAYLGFIFYMCVYYIRKGEDIKEAFISVYIMFFAAIGCGT